MIWLWIIVGLFALLLLIDIVISAALFLSSIPRKRLKFGPLDRKSHEKPDEKLIAWQQYVDSIRDWADTIEHEEVQIMSDDGLRLYASFFPVENPKATVILVHGYLSNGYIDFSALFKPYHNAGLNILLIDQRAQNRSAGKYIGFGVLECRDLLRWIEFLNNRSLSPIYLHGVSMGATTVLMASGLELPQNVRGIIADCGFTSAWDEFSHVLKLVYHLPVFPILPTASLICKIFAGYGFRDVSTLDVLRTQKLPILLIHGDSDNFVPTRMSQENYNRCTAQKQIFIAKNASHGASCFAEPERFFKTISNFINEHTEVGSIEQS